MKWLLSLLVSAAFACALWGAGEQKGDQKAPPWEKNHVQIGQALYRANCVVCHDIDRPQAESKKFGPSFYQLFHREKMPLAAMPPSRAYIKLRVKFGGAIMPAFAKTLNDGEIDTIIDYIQSK